jgi:hypothetical protein
MAFHSTGIIGWGIFCNISRMRLALTQHVPSKDISQLQFKIIVWSVIEHNTSLYPSIPENLVMVRSFTEVMLHC